jgi:hypothetical protein
MPEILMLEFDGLGHEEYAAVNNILGIDMESGEGPWPDGLITHLAGPKQDGWVVLEVWESQAQQEAFMNERLGAALAEGGAGAPARVEWAGVAAHHNPGA